MFRAILITPEGCPLFIGSLSMTSATIKTTISEAKRQAFELRQADTGWGRALAQSWIPFYWIYYASTRRTITPWLCAIALAISGGIVVRVVVGDKSETSIEQLGQLTGLIVAPFGYKLGTNKARAYAKKRMEED